MKVLSLFDGMSCGMIAMILSNVEVDRYVAYEVDKYAIKTAEYNFPNIEEKGDVFSADFTEYANFDWLVGGSPCTYWSIAQTKNRETEASGIGWELFCQYVRALNEAKPKFFIYENNKSMSTSIRDSIRKTFGFDEVCINSSLLSAQNRKRFYWVGKREEDGTYSKVDIDQPNDLNIVLRDVLDQSFVQYLTKPPRNSEKSPNSFLSIGGLPRPNGDISTSAGMRIYSIEGKSRYLCANGGGQGAKTGLYAFPLNITKDGKSQTIKSQYHFTSTCNICCYKSTYGASGVAEAIPTYIHSISEACEYSQDGTPVKFTFPETGRTYDIYNVSNNLITIKDVEYPIDLPDGYYIIRRLTVSECKRLQTVPDWYKFPVSDTQAYKMLGNGWTCAIISYLIDSCIKL